MTTRTLYSFLLSFLGLALVSFATSERAWSQDAAVTSTNETGSPSRVLFETMMTMAQQMTEIAESVTTVDDARNAEPKIAAMMDNMVERLGGLLETIGVMSIEESIAMQNLMDDPELNAAMESADAAVARLKAENSEAATMLEEIGRKHGAKVENVMTQLMMKAMESQDVYEEEEW